MAGVWTKMDACMDDDPKILEYLARSGTTANAKLVAEARYLRLVRAWTLTDDGRLDIGKPGDLALIERKVGLTGKRLTAWLDLLCECSLISDSAWMLSRTVCSERSVKDASTRNRQSEAGKAAAKAKQASRLTNRATNR